MLQQQWMQVRQDSHVLFGHTSSHVTQGYSRISCEPGFCGWTLSKVQLNMLARTQIPEVLFFIIFPHVAAMLQITGSLLVSADSLLLNF